ncbi:hypothetical protein EDB19DRAFT_1835544 [Suillus lakei]|nr:hypothetical protein EDB19DRAFT_1835544 [Suillus lakei]
MPGLQQARLALHNSVRQEVWKPLHAMCLLHDKEDQVYLCDSGIPAETLLRSLYHLEDEVKDTLQGSFKCSPHLAIEGPNSHTPDVTAVTTSKAQTHGHSKTITAVKAPAPAPAHKNSIFELGSASSSTQCAHARSPCHGNGDLGWCSLNCYSQGSCGRAGCVHVTPRICTPLIDFSMEGMAPTPLKVEDASAIEGLLFEYNEVQPKGPHMSGETVDPGDLGNLVPEYNSDDMDVEVKVEEDDMAT